MYLQITTPEGQVLYVVPDIEHNKRIFILYINLQIMLTKLVTEQEFYNFYAQYTYIESEIDGHACYICIIDETIWYLQIRWNPSHWYKNGNGYIVFTTNPLKQDIVCGIPSIPTFTMPPNREYQYCQTIHPSDLILLHSKISHKYNSFNICDTCDIILSDDEHPNNIGICGVILM